MIEQNKAPIPSLSQLAWYMTKNDERNFATKKRIAYRDYYHAYYTSHNLSEEKVREILESLVETCPLILKKDIEAAVEAICQQAWHGIPDHYSHRFV